MNNKVNIRKRKYEEVISFCNELGLECLSKEFITIKTPMLFKCTECGEEFRRTFDNLKTRRNTVCRACGIKEGARKNTFSYKYVKSYVEDGYSNGCKLLSTEYKKSNDLLKFKCVCGDIFEKSLDGFKQSPRCEKCSNKLLSTSNAKPIKELKKMVKEAGYKLLDNKLEGKDQRILVQCENNHSPYWVAQNHFQSGRRCPYCNYSRGERKISDFLNNYEISFENEKIFNDLIGIGGGYLRFDFAIYNNKELYVLIEYDGKQHFEEAFGKDSNFERIKIHDKMKNEFCKENNIKLLRIKYTEFDNVENILNKELKGLL